MKVSKDFYLEEFVGPKAIKDLGNKAIELIDNRIIVVVQTIRNILGVPITINDWVDGGRFDECGLRDIDSKTGATYSQHKFGRAADMHAEGISPEMVRNVIRENWVLLHKNGLTTIEKDTPGWVHVDCRFTGVGYLYEVPFK